MWHKYGANRRVPTRTGAAPTLPRGGFLPSQAPGTPPGAAGGGWSTGLQSEGGFIAGETSPIVAAGRDASAALMMIQQPLYVGPDLREYHEINWGSYLTPGRSCI